MKRKDGKKGGGWGEASVNCSACKVKFLEVAKNEEMQDEHRYISRREEEGGCSTQG